MERKLQNRTYKLTARIRNERRNKSNNNLSRSGRRKRQSNSINHTAGRATRPPHQKKGGKEMVQIKVKKTGEIVEAANMEEAQELIRAFVMFTNMRINNGIISGKRDSKRNYEIIGE